MSTFIRKSWCTACRRVSRSNIAVSSFSLNTCANIKGMNLFAYLLPWWPFFLITMYPKVINFPSNAIPSRTCDQLTDLLMLHNQQHLHWLNLENRRRMAGRGWGEFDAAPRGRVRGTQGSSSCPAPSLTRTGLTTQCRQEIHCSPCLVITERCQGWPSMTKRRKPGPTKKAVPRLLVWN